jgi:tRNA (guanine26-N2/guanine27-N2)-dimethyltransferase
MAPAKSKKPPSPKADAPPVSITDQPVADQFVKHGDKTYTTVKEGLAYILIPPDAPRLLDPKTHASEPAQSVFYNPIQQYNRDLTVLAIRAFGEDLLARHALKTKRKRGKRTGQQVKTKEGAKNESVRGKATEYENLRIGGGHVEEPVSKKRKLENDESADVDSKGQKADDIPAEPENAATNQCRLGEDHQPTEPDDKRQKVTAEFTEFEDGGIDDDDLLAVESSMRHNEPPSAVREPTENGEKGQKPADGEIVTPKPPAEERDTRPQFRILDALSATGLRALRYAQELPFNTQVTANDLSKAAVEAIKLNVKHNRLEKKIKTSVGNANAHMYSFVAQEGVGGPGNKYHVIDIDPYGTAVPFLDAAVQATADNGLLCVTCTDTGVFNSMGYAEKAFALYGGLPGRGDHCHEIGLRLILHSITTTAAKYGIAIEPLLSLSIDYYARVFVRVKRSPADVKFLANKTMLVYTCDHGCGAWKPQFMMRAAEQQGKKGSVWHKHTVAQAPTADRLCECCGSKMHVAGPMYGGPLHNPAFIQKILDLASTLDKETYKTLPRIEGMLSLAQEEMALHDATKLTVPTGLPKQEGSPKQKRGYAENQAGVLGATANKDAPIEDGNGSKAPAGPNDDLPTKIPTANIQDDASKEESSAELIEHMYESLSPSVLDQHPFYIIPSSLSRVLHCQAPSDAAFRGALKGLGFQAVRSHAQPGTIKTDAPWESIWDVMVAWTKEKPIREGALTEGMAGYKILRKVKEREVVRLGAEKAAKEDGSYAEGNNTSESEGTMIDAEEDQSRDQAVVNRKKIVFDENLGREPPKSKRLVRYQINPRANWGPMARAK